MRRIPPALLLLCVTFPADAQMRGGRFGGADWFEAADTNHDGIVTRAEFQAYRMVMFDRLDRNHDGVVSPADFPLLARARPEAYQRLTRLLDGADRNNDGVVSKDEVADAPMRIFDLADADHDGRVTREEAQSLRETVRSRMDDRRQR